MRRCKGKNVYLYLPYKYTLLQAELKGNLKGVERNVKRQKRAQTHPL
jgi:hypothetical protein